MKVVALTQRQQKVLDFIRSHFLASGHPPTLRDIGAFMGIRSTNGVNDHLKALERKGVLIRGPEVLEQFRAATAARLEALDAMTQADFDAPSWTPAGPG